VRHDPVRVQHLVVPQIVNPDNGLRSNSGLERQAAVAGLVLLGPVVDAPVVPVDPVDPEVAPVVPVVDVRVPVVAVAVPVAEQLVRLVVAGARANPASQSARSVKSLKCGRRRA
jgi:hypothetical protein